MGSFVVFIDYYRSFPSDVVIYIEGPMYDVTIKELRSRHRML